MGKPPKKILVFVIDEHGRTLKEKSLHKLISEFFEKAMDEPNVDAVVFNGASINVCVNLANGTTGKDISDWEIIYLHGSKYPPVLLTQENKEELLTLLPDFKGTSAEAIYKVLVDSGVFS